MVTNYLTFLSWRVKFMLPPLESGLVYDWLDHLGMVRKDPLPALGLVYKRTPSSHILPCEALSH